MQLQQHRCNFIRASIAYNRTSTMAPASKSTRQGKVDIWVDVSKVKLADGRLELCQLSRLLQLIRERHFDAIANLVAKGVPSILDHVHPNGDGETALGLAASVNDNEMLEHLVSLGADPNVYDLRGRSAAMRAADLGHVQSMNALAKAGIDMTIVDETGQGKNQVTGECPRSARAINMTILT
jgi:ankyrin repeat protein